MHRFAQDADTGLVADIAKPTIVLIKSFLFGAAPFKSGAASS
jgi:hypothetical protein